MRIVLDPEQCYGSGDCVHRAPAVFTKVDGLGAVIPGREHDVDAPRVREAAEGCPSAAITLTRTDPEGTRG
ncbi:ferredoxin [Streptomyces sp. BK208]|uniref:ferredoxin n=1 Tax=Streptomyces sp. BK208 TaxID=2512150 RepID=UPI001060467D|nr:ferredoxin [Streptomyces sp. BK208]TDT28649.1 ferredoxin [Streptomyces sp. BK208]